MMVCFVKVYSGCFYTPDVRQDVLWYGLRPSVRPSVRPLIFRVSAIAPSIFHGFLSNLVWTLFRYKSRLSSIMGHVAPHMAL